MREPYAVDLNLSHARALAIKAAEDAGALVRNRLFDHLTVQEKGSLGDVVTDLDYASENLIISIIRTQYPDHRVISEELENSKDNSWSNGNPWTWLVDPVDGTNNIVIGLPVLAVGITLCWHETPVVSVVHDPVSQRTWSAILKQGAWDNTGSPVLLPGPKSKRKPVIAWIQGYSVSRNDWEAAALKMVLAYSARRILELWAPLTCWMMLVRGDIDGIVGYRIGELDLYAGVLIASEVGICTQDFSGRPFVPKLRGTADDHYILAGSPRIVAQLTEMVSAAKRFDSDLGRLVTRKLDDGNAQ